MDAHKIVRAVFARNFVVSNVDGAGTNETPTLRYALTNAIDGDSVTLPAGGTISLTSTLPNITKSITIAGNGATLTWSTTPTSGLSNSSLLRIDGEAVKLRISRLHFKGGKATNGAAIHNMKGTLTLESCIFSNNEATNLGGAIYTADGNNVAVLGCTFYNNKAKGGGVIYTSNGTNFLTGNLFFGNTSSSIGNVAYNYYNPNLESGGYNVSDYEDGYTSPAYNRELAGNPNGSGYTGTTGDLFEVKDIVFATGGDPTTSPSSNATLKTLTSLPQGFPTTYFDGNSRETSATAGAVNSN
jgi:predicted outer membrane repeat protein